MNPLVDFRFQIYTKLSYLTNNSHESFFCANILTVVTSVYANNKSNHINLLFCFALNECKQIEYGLRVPRSGTYIMKPTASCEAAPLWVRASPPSKYSSPKGDLHILYDIEDDSRSRFAEPREGEVMPIPLLRSFGACSGFLIDTCPIGTRR